VSSLSAGWRLVTGLAGLAAVMGIVVAILPGGPDDDEQMRPSVARPWAICVQEVRRELPPLGDTEVVGPIESVWEPSGKAVEMLGALRPGAQRDRPFACRAVLLGSRWTVDRLVFGR
jgi:hypothetical protein